jgi:DNA-binding Lrp family transcriptional regulator
MGPGFSLNTSPQIVDFGAMRHLSGHSRDICAMARDLDDFDIKILATLARQGRISWRELADAIGLSPTPTLRRVRALEADGFILGYHAKIDEVLVGRGISVFVSVRLDAQHDEALAQFEGVIEAVPEVMSCFMMTGTTDYLLRVVVPDLEAYQTFISRTLTRIPHVANVSSGFTLKSVVQRIVPPLPPLSRGDQKVGPTPERRDRLWNGKH